MEVPAATVIWTDVATDTALVWMVNVAALEPGGTVTGAACATAGLLLVKVKVVGEDEAVVR